MCAGAYARVHSLWPAMSMMFIFIDFIEIFSSAQPTVGGTSVACTSFGFNRFTNVDLPA
jgi:hypothetical protein